MDILETASQLSLTAIGLAFLFACGEPDAASPAQRSVLEQYPMTAQAMHQWKLPGKLKEISGLALSDDGRLFAVTDEEAIVYEIDYHEGRLVKAFALGNPTVRADFEGIAVIGRRFYLTTSDGEIFASREGADGERVSYAQYDTGLGKHCEIEGLAAIRQELLLLCKKVRSHDLIDGLVIFVWESTSEKVLMSGLIELPESEILSQLESENLSPSGLAIDDVTGNLLIIAAQQRVVVEISDSGELIHVREMPLAKRHRQAEGIEITRAGRLLIGDEGSGRKARIAVYRTAEATDEERQ